MAKQSENIASITRALNAEVNNLNLYFNAKYKALINQHEETRFRDLQTCLRQVKASMSKEEGASNSEGLADCVKQYQKKQINVDFESNSRKLSECVSNMFEAVYLHEPKKQLAKANKTQSHPVDQKNEQIQMNARLSSCIWSYRTSIESSLDQQLPQIKKSERQ